MNSLYKESDILVNRSFKIIDEMGSKESSCLRLQL